AAIFLAMGVILLSLMIASVALPILTDGLADLRQPLIGRSEDSARTAAAEAAVRRIEKVMAVQPKDKQAAAVRSEAAVHLLDVYNRRLHYGDPSGEDTASMQAVAEAERQLRLEALAAERDEIYRLLRTREIDDDLHRLLVREIDLMETSLSRKRGH
ncbi:MAG TPA: Na+/H+ antiporter, partial [Burkholderiaceae bacterium]|nr:Na+/H+ antiporter [Burkholderiaceae bacterium]